jgi:hypothetical protein
MTRTILVAPCLLALACGGAQPSATVDELRAAVPRQEWLSMSLAPSRAPAQAMCSTSGASTFGTMTHRIAGTVDGVIAGVFSVVGQVSSQPPASTRPGQAMWGPIVGASSVYTLAVEQAGPTEFRFFLGGEPQGAGNAWKGVFGGSTVVADPQHRTGEVDVNFSVMHALDSTVDPVAGGAAVRFAVDGGARSVMAHFGGIVGKNAPQPDDSDYAFTAAPDQTAGFAFATHVDFDHDGTLDEVVQIQSRWAADGSGTAHVVVTGGSLGQRTVNVVECWDSTLARVFYSDDQDMNARSGDQACCPR